jgi:hypothetical protein
MWPIHPGLRCPSGPVVPGRLEVLRPRRAITDERCAFAACDLPARERCSAGFYGACSYKRSEPANGSCDTLSGGFSRRFSDAATPIRGQSRPCRPAVGGRDGRRLLFSRAEVRTSTRGAANRPADGCRSSAEDHLLLRYRTSNLLRRPQRFTVKSSSNVRILASSWISAHRIRHASASEIGRSAYFFNSASISVQCSSTAIPSSTPHAAPARRPPPDPPDATSSTGNRLRHSPLRTIAAAARTHRTDEQRARDARRLSTTRRRADLCRAGRRPASRAEALEVLPGRREVAWAVSESSGALSRERERARPGGAFLRHQVEAPTEDVRL